MRKIGQTACVLVSLLVSLTVFADTPSSKVVQVFATSALHEKVYLNLPVDGVVIPQVLQHGFSTVGTFRLESKRVSIYITPTPSLSFFTECGIIRPNAKVVNITVNYAFDSKPDKPSLQCHITSL